MRLPHGSRAILDVRKLEDYCLDPRHPRGRHKARIFQAALDLERSDAAWLRDVLLSAARSSEQFRRSARAWGTEWRADISITRHRMNAIVRTVWLVRTGETLPRFITCWVV